MATMATKEKPAEKDITITKDDILSAISKMNIMELADLVKALEDKFDIKAAAMPIAPTAQGAAQSNEAVEEQTEFTVTLAEIGSEKIKVIKEVRSITSLGLKEAKELVEAAPKVIKENVSKEDAAKIKQQIEAVGAKVEVK